MTNPVVNIETPVAPPTWALLEQQLLKAMSDACVQLFGHYFDEQDARRVLNDDWVKYLNGLNPDYPVEALNEDFDELHARLEEM